MIDATKDLDEEKLRENFRYWIAQWPTVSDPRDRSLPESLLPTAHTFGFYRELLGDKQFVYEDILLRDRALVCDKSRKQNKKLLPERVRRLKLHHFVFSYFGIHDPYYTRGGELAVPGFGVFIKATLENFPICNATRRDVNSPEVKRPLAREFLLPGDAKALAFLQAENDDRHGGNFWHYWGDPGLFVDDHHYSAGHWEWKIELHFRDRVPVEDFAAILWPFELRAVRAGRLERRMLGDYGAFQALFPDCKVIPYNWEEPGQNRSLLFASYAVARYYLANNKFPEEADDAY